MEDINLSSRPVVDSDQPIWRVKLTDGGDKGSNYGPIKSNDTLFVVTGKYLHAITLEGNIIWSFLSESVPRKPIILSDLIIFSDLKNCITALETKNGAKRWELKLKSDISFAPVSDIDSIYFIDDENKVFAIDPNIGTLKWTSQQNNRLRYLTIADGLLFTYIDRSNSIIALNTMNGETVWSLNLYSVSSLRAYEGTLYSNTTTEIVQINPTTGTIIFTIKLYDDPKSEIVVDNKKIYVQSGDGVLICIHRESHQVVWKYQGDYNSYVPTEPVVMNNMVFCPCLLKQHFCIIDATSGQLLKSMPLMTNDLPFVVNSTVYILLQSRTLCAFNINDLIKLTP
jgi:outer membrane protein assembly factor BamB